MELPRKPRSLAALGHPSEHEVQKTIVAYARSVLVGAIIFAVPNAARRNPGGRAGNAVPGLLKGVPDLVVIASGGRALMIEVKSETGVLRPEQRALNEWFMRHNVPYVVARKIEDVRAAFAQFRFETREAA